MVECVADILTEDELAIIINVASERQSLFGFRAKISAIARGQTKVPRLIRPEAKTRVERWLIETHFGSAP